MVKAWTAGRVEAFADTLKAYPDGDEPKCIADLMAKCSATKLVDCTIPVDWAENFTKFADADEPEDEDFGLP